MKGVVYGVGVGPGDPALMTLAAVRLIREKEVFALPGTEPRETAAYKIAAAAVPELKDRTLIPLHLPMTADRGAVEAACREAASQIEAWLDRGRDVVCLTLGDPSVYSTFGGIRRYLLADGCEVRTVAGVPSFCAAAARLNVPLAAWDEPLHIWPAAHLGAKGLDLPGNAVLMKPGSAMAEIKHTLRDGGREAMMVENCGMAGERVYEGADSLPDAAGYFSVVIVRRSGEKGGE